MKKLFVLILSFHLLACHTSQKAATTNVAETKTAINQFTVSFISIGSGPDGSAKTSYNAFIESFEKQNKVKLVFDKVNWGREGETDYCFDFNELNQSLRNAFVVETKKLLANSKLVRYFDNTPCRSPRK